MADETTAIHHGDEAAILWRHVPADCALRRWSEELRALAAAATFDRTAWGAAGHAVVIEHEDPEDAQAMLAAAAADIGISLTVITREAMGADVSCWLDALPAEQPHLLLLERGEWLGGELDDGDDGLGFPRDPQFDDTEGYRFRRSLLHALRNEVHDMRLVIVTCLKRYSELATELRCAGGFDRRLELPRIAPEAHAEAFIQRWGASLFDSSVESNRKRLGHLLRSEYQQARRRGLLAQALMRSARKEDRKISWTDLIEVATHGTRERDFQPQTEGQRLKNAVHEAGHVLISYLCTGQAPIYCSVRDSGNDHGVTVMPYDLVEAFNQDMSYAGAIEQIRMALAGRAAEHLVLGAQNVSLYGAKDDLRLAKELATQMHALAGMPIETHDDAAAGSNLCVASSEKDTVGRESFIAMINRVLQREFLQTIGMIKAERAVLERIVNDLRDREVLLEEDLVNLLQPA